MKKIFSQWILLTLIIIVISCNKTNDEATVGFTTLRLKMADANADILVEFPTNSIMLNGRAWPYNSNNPISQTIWKKISGPSTCVIQNANSLQTKVTNLEKGDYQFEFTVYDRVGNYDIDTMTLNVVDQAGPDRQIIFSDMKMLSYELLLWVDYYLGIENFHEFVPANTPFTVHLKKGTSLTWEEVFPAPPNNGLFNGYVYYLPNGNVSDLIVTEQPDGFVTKFYPNEIKITYR